jgi:hypothetical protein
MSTKKKTSTTQTNSAAAWAQPSITGALGGLDTASGVSSANAASAQPYLQSAIQSIANGITNPTGYQQAAGSQLTNMINGGSANPYTSQIAGYDASNPYTSQLGSQDFSNISGGDNQYISQLASGQNDYIDKLMDVNSSTNPYAAAQADQLGAKTGASYAASFGGAGRSGSGLASLLGTQGIGDTLNNFYSNQYATDQGYRNSALTTAANLKNQSLTSAAQLQDSQNGRDMAAAQAQDQLHQSGLQSAGQLSDASNARGLSAVNAASGLAADDSNRQLQAIGQAPAQYAGSLQGIAPLLNAASTSTLLPLQGASAYSGAVGQLTQPYGTQQTNSTSSTSGLGTVLGPALQLGGMLAGGGLSGGLSGLLGGAAPNALAGLPALSALNTTPNTNITGMNFRI